MSNFLFDTDGLETAHVESFDATCKALKDQHRVEIPGYINFQLEQFELLRPYNDVNTRDVFALKNGSNDSYMLFLEVSANLANKGQFKNHSQYQPWALTYLKQNFGRVVIRTETFFDKLKELVLPIELDFKEDKPFSDRFYVLTDDRRKAEKAMDQSFRDAVMSIEEKDFIIEIVEHTLIIGNRKPIEPDHACYLADFVTKLAAIA
jgi:hypothetical protein